MSTLLLGRDGDESPYFGVAAALQLFEAAKKGEMDKMLPASFAPEVVPRVMLMDLALNRTPEIRAENAVYCDVDFTRDGNVGAIGCLHYICAIFEAPQAWRDAVVREINTQLGESFLPAMVAVILRAQASGRLELSMEDDALITGCMDERIRAAAREMIDAPNCPLIGQFRPHVSWLQEAWQAWQGRGDRHRKYDNFDL